MSNSVHQGLDGKLQQYRGEVFTEIEKNALTNRELAITGLAIVPAVLKLAVEKGKLYGNSYCKYGNTGIFFNLARKMDRIENSAKLAFSSNLPILDLEGAGESVVDTIVDMANYSLLWLGYIARTEPEKLKQYFSEEEYELLLNLKKKLD